MKKLYIDVCALCRPFDNQHVLRLRLETDAVLLITENIRSGNYEMVISDVHFKELSQIEDYQERTEIMTFLNTYGKKNLYDKVAMKKRTKELRTLHIKVADAAHFAIAEKTADVFISTDDALLKKSKKNGKIISLNPIEFCSQENLL
ncbi:MAG: hypothetical protein HYZ34_03820 [Ignavibacteriae bacterium]|nr:hypothetical protein [Ignavibacteriota bacterium]